jgi:hypothetical protein
LNVLENFLTPEFKKNRQTLSAANLVKKYGTHVLSNVHIGATFNVFYQAATNASDRSASQITGFTYVLRKVFG